MKKWLQDKAVEIFILLCTVILTLAFGLYMSHRIIEKDFPRLEMQISELSRNQEKSISQFKSDLNVKLTENIATQEKRLSKVEGTVSTIKFNLVSLMNKVGKIPSEAQLKELLAVANDISQSKAKYFSEAKLTKASDNLPASSHSSGWAGVAMNLGLEVPKEEAVQGTTDVKDIQSLLTRSIVTEAAHWKVVNNTLVVNYEDGSIIYRPIEGLPPEKLDEMVFELNDVGMVKKTWLKPQVIEKK